MASEKLADLFDSFEEEAFRLETLDDYSGSGNVDAYRTFLAGEPQPADYNDGWVEELRRHTSAGKRVRRVHVLSRPLTPYLRFELGWGHRKNATGGEEFFVLDTTDRSDPLHGVPDFWLFDGVTPAVMRYTGDGSFAGADIVPDDRSREFRTHRDTALANAVPFADRWAKHGG